MAFAQLTFRESLRDIEVCPAREVPSSIISGFVAVAPIRWPMPTLCATGESMPILPKPNPHRPAVVCARVLGVDLQETVYALNTTTIDLRLSVFPWAVFRTAKAAIKLHTLLICAATSHLHSH